ncbi:MAG: DNA cytosine methyltransferase [Prevotella sp.]
MESYHINQRDEGIDLHGKSGALMATTNMQMQTFVTQAEEDTPIAFAANQRDEVRDLHDVAGALGSQPGMKQQTFIAAGFSAGQGSKAGGIGYQEEIAPTLKGAESGTNMVPSVLCLNDQGGKVMECSENVTGTLRAQEHGHQPLVYENHGIDSRYTGPHEVCPTMSARYGTGGNNVPLVEQEPVFCITGNAIDRQPQNGGNGIGYQEDISYTLTATDHHAVFSRQRVDIFKGNDVVSTQSARQHKDATDLVYQAEVFGHTQFGNYSPGCTTLRAQGGDNGGGSENLVAQENTPSAYLIRRLTPLECERLQGFPDGWTDIEGASDSSRYKALGNSVAIPCVEFIMHGLALALKAG